MDFVKPLSTIISMFSCMSTLAVFSVLGNGLVLGIIARFKKLRTFPNILIANLALADLLNALINMPIYLLYDVLQVSWFKGKTLAILSSCLHNLFVLLNLVSMIVLMVNAFLAIAFGLKYYTWKTNKRAIVIVVFEWLVCTAVAVSASVPLLDVDLQDAKVILYRQRFFSEQRVFLVAITTVFIVCTIVTGILIVCSVRRNKLKRKRLNLSPLQAEPRSKQDIKTSKTVGITVLIFITCYIPVTSYSASGRKITDLPNTWFAFLATLSIFISSGVNPVVYSFRTRRFRLALRQLVKDPCGRSPFQETTKRVEKIQRQNTKPTVARKRITDMHENEKSKENAGQSRDLDTNENLSSHELEAGSHVKIAWTENDQNGDQKRSSENLDERPTTSGVNTKQEVTVEIHSFHQGKSDREQDPDN